MVKELTKKVTISMTESEQNTARNLSVLLLGQENISGLLRFLLHEADRKARKKIKEN